MGGQYMPGQFGPGDEESDSPLTDGIEALLRAVAFEAPEETEGAVDASLATLERRLAAVEGPQATARLREATARIRLEVARRIQRATQLQRLLQGVQQMLATSGPDQLLEVVVSRTRDLLGCDISHMNLLPVDGAGGYAFMRATSGAHTSEFRGLRTPPGHGVTALVARTRNLYTTLDYLTDPRINHSEEANLAMRLEGVRSMHAVPLMLGSEVVGVLAADYRRVFQMSSDQTDILSALAALAALALDSARSLTEKQEAIAQLRATHEAAQATNNLLEWSGEAHDRLTNVVLGGGGLDAVATAVHEVFGCGTAIIGPDGTILARATDSEATALSSQELGRARGGTIRLEHDGVPVWASPIVAGQECLGTLVADSVELGTIEERTFERSALVTALLMMMQRSVDEAEARVASEVVEDLLVRGDLSEGTVRKARSLGLDTSGVCAALVVESESTSGELHRAVSGFAHERGGLVGRGSGRATVVLPGDEAETLAEALHHHCLTRLGVPVWVGAASAASISAVAAAGREAGSCLRALNRLRPDDPRGGWATPESLGFVGMLLGMSSVRKVEDLVSTQLGALVDYDQRHGTSLVETVDVFFESDAVPEAAHRLNVHRNTVVQRLNRVSRLLGDDWRGPERSLELRLALRLHRLARPGDPPLTPGTGTDR